MCLFKGLHVLTGPPAPRHLSLGEAAHAGISSLRDHIVHEQGMTGPS